MVELGLSLSCRVRDRKGRYVVEFSEKDRLFIQDTLKYWNFRGGQVQFSLGKPGPPRTIGMRSQQAHFNGHVQQIAMETGVDFDRVKRFIKTRALTRGYPVLYCVYGIPVIDEWGNTQGISEADATTAEAGMLIDTIHQFADWWGIKLREE